MNADLLRETFQRETEELLAALEEGLLEFEANPDSGSVVDSLFRVAHTLKGNAGMVGFAEFVRLTHVLENVLDRLRSHTLRSSDAVHEALFAGLDALKTAAVSFAQSGAFAATPEYDAAISALHEQCDGEQIAQTELRERVWEVCAYFRSDFWRSGEDLPSFLEELGLLGELISVQTLVDRVPALSELAVGECHLGLRVVLRTTAGPMGVMGVCFLSVDEENIRINELAPAAERAHAELAPREAEPAAAPAKPGGEVAGPRASHAKANTLRVDADKLDRLMDLVGELVIGIAQVSDRQHAAQSEAALERLAALGRELQDNVMALRMLPIHDTFERFRRPIRDLARELGKSVDFVVSGGATQVDKKVLDALLDPLKHMLRNCVSHGIELPEERTRAGKAEIGQIHLSAAQREGHVLIEIRDDGRGIDRARVLAKAEERGLIAKGQALSDAQVYELLFVPGFSTASELSEISGRGVGLDVVRREIQNLHGSVETRSVFGQGTSFRLRLPLTLTIVEGMNVRVGGETVTIPLLSVVELIARGPRTLKTVEGKHEYVDLRGELLPVLRLRELLELPSGDDTIQDPHVVIVETEQRKFGLLVDRVLGTAQTVIKPLDRSYELFARMTQGYEKPRGVNGAAILGDGHVGIILDVHGLESSAFGAA